MKIEIPLFDMANEKNIQCIYSGIEIKDNYFIWQVEYYSEKPVSTEPEDHSMGWRECYTNFLLKIKKDLFVGIERNYFDKRDVWGYRN